MSQECPHAARRLGPVARALNTTLGAICVGLATAGVFLPILPTTIFLIMAVAFFGRGCPVLREKVLAWRIFQPFRPYVERRKPMPPAARNSALVMMWLAIAASAATVVASARIPDLLGVALVLAGFLGTAAILRAARPVAPGTRAEAVVREPRAD